MLFGFGVLVYYMDRNFMVNNSQVMINNLNSNKDSNSQLKQPKAESRILNTRIIKIKNSQEDNSVNDNNNDKNAQNSPLPPYKTEELKLWIEPNV